MHITPEPLNHKLQNKPDYDTNKSKAIQHMFEMKLIFEFGT